MREDATTGGLRDCNPDPVRASLGAKPRTRGGEPWLRVP